MSSGKTHYKKYVILYSLSLVYKFADIFIYVNLSIACLFILNIHDLIFYIISLK